jgi:glycosyltransferase involved in cell wall biosynthesis
MTKGGRVTQSDWPSAVDDRAITVLCFTGNSGLTDYSVSLCRSLARHAQTRLITSTTIDSRFCALGFEVAQMFRRTREYPADVMRVIWRLVRAPRQIILFQGPLKWAITDGIVARLLRAVGHRLVLTVHDVMPHYPKPWSQYTQKFFMRSFDRLVVHSKRASDDVRRLGVTLPILTVPHGLYDLFCMGRSTPGAARKNILGNMDRRVSVLFFGHLEPRKGFFEFLQVAKSLDATEKYVFVAAGPDGFRSRGERQAASALASQLQSFIFRPGRVPHDLVEEYFLAADIVVLPYLEGTTSGVLKIAIAFGTPVIATDVGDIRENVPRGGGVVVRVGAKMVEELTAAVVAVANAHAAFRQHMAEGVAGLDWETIGGRYYDFLEAAEGIDGVLNP